MKIFEFMEKYKSMIVAIVAIIIVALCAVGFYKTDVANDNQTLLKSCTLGEITSIDDTIEVTQGQTMVQKYKCDNLHYKQIGFVAKGTSADAELEVIISDGDKNQTKTFTADQLSTGYTYIDFDEAITNSDRKQIEMTFNIKKGTFVFSANKTAEVDGSSCTVDGDARATNAVIDMRTLKDSTGDLKYIIIAVSVVLFLTAIFFVIKFRLLSIAGLTAVILAFFCIVCFFIFPPFTVPDEATHYKSVYHVSNMIMFDFKDEQKALRMRECDYDYVNSARNSLYDQRYISEKGFDSFTAENNEVTTTHYGYMINKTVPHFAGGLGLTIARILGLGPYWAFMVARLFNAAMCIALMYFAIKIMPFGKIALAAIALIPINLHIIASCSYDAFTFGGVMLMFAYMMHLMYDKANIDWKKLLILALIIALVVPQKVVYIGVAALLLIIPKERFANPKWHFAFKCALGAIAVLSILLLQISNVDKVVSETATNSTAAGYSIGYVLQNPLAIAKMLVRTILIQGDFYVKSLISFFGWFEFQTPWFMAIPYLIILCFAFMRKKDEPVIGAAQRWYSLLLFIVVFILIELLLLLDHTYMGSQIVLGVQGRYFIPALPLLFVFLRNNTVELKNNFDNKMLFLTTVLNSGMFIYCCAKIV